MKLAVTNNVTFVKGVPEKPFVISTDEKDYLVVWDCASKKRGKQGYYILYNMETGKSCSRHFVAKGDGKALAQALHDYFKSEAKKYQVVESTFTLDNPTEWDDHDIDVEDIPFAIATPNKNYFVGYDCKRKELVGYNLETGNSCFRFAKDKMTEENVARYFEAVTYKKGDVQHNVDWIVAALSYELDVL